MISKNIPGTIPVEGRAYLYIADDGEDYFSKGRRQSKKQSLFEKVTSQFNIAQSGGVISENCKIWLPTNELFHGLSYKGDITGWQSQIMKGAESLGLLTACILDAHIVLSDSRSYALSACKVAL